MPTWYVLEDGTFADPAECAPDKKGALKHKDGMAVAIGAHGNPLTRSMSPKDMEPKRKTRAMEAEEPATYKTRKKG